MSEIEIRLLMEPAWSDLGERLALRLFRCSRSCALPWDSPAIAPGTSPLHFTGALRTPGRRSRHPGRSHHEGARAQYRSQRERAQTWAGTATATRGS